MMDNSEVVKFMGHFGPNSVADMCVLWLIRKHRLYFHPFTQDVVRWLLLVFCRKCLDDAQVKKWMETKSYDISFFKLLIDDLWITYCESKEYAGKASGIEEIDSIRMALHANRKEKSSIISMRKNELRIMLRIFYDELLPLVISAKKDAFEEQLDIESVIKRLEDDFNELKTTESKEEYLRTLFNGYSNSLFNRILTPIEPYVDCSEENITRVVPIISKNSGYRQSHILRRYKSEDNYNRIIKCEQRASNELLCMMTSQQAVTVAPTQSDVIITQLGSYANPFVQFGEALKVLLANNHIILDEIKEKYGISIDVNISINYPNSDLSRVHHIQQSHMPVISPDGSLHLPPMLDTPKAREVFRNAISKGLIVPSPDGKLLWIGIEEKSKNSQLAFLCEKIYEGDYDIRGNKGKSMPFQELESLFNVKKMSTTIQQVHDAKRVQKWRSAIEQLLF